ncbi:MAG: UDP-N-acetylglucosamine 4,6-dehydratase (inverting) [Bdellovibrionota bacterium]
MSAENFAGKTVLITGGTGSFGRQFALTFLNRYPNLKKLIILSRDEFKQFEMQNLEDFKKHSSVLRFFIGDVREKDRLMRAFEGVDFVIHAAALKQVPTCEYNPFEAIKTNILGAQNVINAALDMGVQKVIALSTDKACAPINLYGATKLCSDKLFIAANAYAGTKNCKFAVVRYGNVAGSRGSVVPFFQKLVRENASEIPITDYRMTRFWLNLEQAVEMVLQALNTMRGGELYVKKLPSMRIVDLATAIAPNIKTVEIGVRPGEKIHEQMIVNEDALRTVEFDDHYIILREKEFKTGTPDCRGGKLVAPDFEYHSGKNTEWLTVEDIRSLLKVRKSSAI